MLNKLLQRKYINQPSENILGYLALCGLDFCSTMIMRTYANEKLKEIYAIIWRHLLYL